MNLKDWETAPDHEIVCYCRNVDKGKILKAIGEGASSLKDVVEKTSAGKGRECAIKNPRKVCCHMDIMRILELYAGKEGNSGNGCG